MSKVELSDAELIATLKATAWHLLTRLTARNAELDELRKIVERQEALVKAAKEAGRPYLMIQDLAPAQKEAPVEPALWLAGRRLVSACEVRLST